MIYFYVYNTDVIDHFTINQRAFSYHRGGTDGIVSLALKCFAERKPSLNAGGCYFSTGFDISIFLNQAFSFSRSHSLFPSPASICCLPDEYQFPAHGRSYFLLKISIVLLTAMQKWRFPIGLVPRSELQKTPTTSSVMASNAPTGIPLPITFQPPAIISQQSHSIDW